MVQIYVTYGVKAKIIVDWGDSEQLIAKMVVFAIKNRPEKSGRFIFYLAKFGLRFSKKALMPSLASGWRHIIVANNSVSY